MSADLIYVVGAPSGGTSAVAGVLYHLGVDMGEFLDGAGIRQYTTYEDTQGEEFKDRNQRGAINPFSFDLWGYIDLRERRRGGQPIGCKLSSGNILPYRHENPPLRLVRVVRPLEDVVRAEIRRQEEDIRPSRDLDTTDDILADIAGYCAKVWWSTDRVCEAIPPASTVYFYELLRDPESVVDGLVDDLGLNPTPRQKLKAISVVDPEMRSV